MPSNKIRSSRPTEETIDENIFNLSLVKYSKVKDDQLDCDERLTLFFVSGNNEICLEEETINTPRQVANKEKTVRDKGYLLKVYDKETKATMYYNVVLARVELEKKEDGVVDGSLSEHLEVIAKLDDEDDNPFNTEFDIPDDYKKKDK